MTAPPTPEPTRKVETLTRAPPTIVSIREEDAALKEVANPRLCCANGISETKTKDGSTAAKVPAPRINPKDESEDRLLLRIDKARVKDKRYI
jgi:hypothetical protein